MAEKNTWTKPTTVYQPKNYGSYPNPFGFVYGFKGITEDTKNFLYIGQSTQSSYAWRLYYYKQDIQKHEKFYPLFKAFYAYGLNSFEYCPLAICYNRIQLDFVETYLVSELKSLKNKHVLNVRKGGRDWDDLLVERAQSYCAAQLIAAQNNQSNSPVEWVIDPKTNKERINPELKRRTEYALQHGIQSTIPCF